MPKLVPGGDDTGWVPTQLWWKWRPGDGPLPEGGPTPSGINGIGGFPDLSNIPATGPDAVPIVYGETMLQGRMIATNNAYATECSAVVGICAGPVDSVIPYKNDGDRLVALPASGAYQNTLGLPWYTIGTSLGDSYGIYPEGYLGGVYQTMKGLLRMDFVQPKTWSVGGLIQPNGASLPAMFHFKVKGRLVLDTRTSTTAWSANPALCLMDFLKDVEYGCGMDGSLIDTASFNAAADICDQVVSSAPRYSLNIALGIDGDSLAWVQKILAHFAARLVVQTNGLLGVVVDASTAQSPVTLDGSNFREAVVSEIERKDLPNRVVIEFPNAVLSWVMSRAIAETAALTAGTDQLREQVLQLEGCTSQVQATTLARYYLRSQNWARSRVVGLASPSIARLPVGTRVNVTAASVSNAPYRIAVTERQENGEVRLELWEYDSAVFSDDAMAIDTPITPPAAPGDLVGWVDGTTYSEVVVTGNTTNTTSWATKKYDLPSDLYIRQIRIRYSTLAWTGATPPSWAACAPGLDPSNVEVVLPLTGNRAAEAGRAYRLYVPGRPGGFSSNTPSNILGASASSGTGYVYVVWAKVEDAFGQLSTGVYYGNNVGMSYSSSTPANSIADGDLTAFRASDSALVDSGVLSSAVAAHLATDGKIPNASFLLGRNAANSADLSLIGPTATDNIALDPSSLGLSIGTPPTGGGAAAKQLALYSMGTGHLQPVFVLNEGVAGNLLTLVNYFSSASGAGGLLSQFARGSKAAPSDVSLSDRLGFMLAGGYAGGAFRNVAGFTCLVAAAGTVSSTSLPTRVQFLTTPDGSVSRREAFGVEANGDVTVLAHLCASGSAPTSAAGTGAGTGPTITVTGNDVAGKITVLTGTAPAAANAIVSTLTATKTWTTAPIVVLTPGNAAAAALAGATAPFVDAASTTTTVFVLKAGATALAAATTYVWLYHAIQ
jgi:hypothetical protein